MQQAKLQAYILFDIDRGCDKIKNVEFKDYEARITLAPDLIFNYTKGEFYFEKYDNYRINVNLRNYEIADLDLKNKTSEELYKLFPPYAEKKDLPYEYEVYFDETHVKLTNDELEEIERKNEDYT